MPHLIKSIINALSGYAVAWREERNLRFHTVAGIIALLLGYFLKISAIEWMFIIGAIALVLALELVNSIFERLLDIVKPSLNEYIRDMKDMMAMSVLIAAAAAIAIGLIIFVPRLGLI